MQLTKIDKSLTQAAMGIHAKHIRPVLGAAFVLASGPQAALAQNCDANYSGVCVPIASDVDCAEGSGNGPAYVAGPVYIVGSDIYGLDRDGDGVACEPR